MMANELLAAAKRDNMMKTRLINISIIMYYLMKARRERDLLIIDETEGRPFACY